MQQMDAVRLKMSLRRVDAALQQVLRDFAKVTLERDGDNDNREINKWIAI